jgi:nicotinic acid mononucleotide adenylyltransferase
LRAQTDSGLSLLAAKPPAKPTPLSYDVQDVAAAIHSSGRRLVIALTGGGSGAISLLLQTPGASRTVLEAVIPYSLAALVDWIGGKPDQACSEATARAMAMAAFMRGQELSPDADPTSLVGIGFTGSLATDRVKRGERRIHLAAQTVDCTEAHSILLDESNPTRAADEACGESILLWLIARSCGVEFPKVTPDSDRWRQDIEQAGSERSELLVGTRRSAVTKPGSITDFFTHDLTPPMLAVFPGAFNPPHAGHLRMAAIAEARLGLPVAWELSITNVDKPPLDFITMRERVAALRTEDDARPIALTRAATFREKAELFPGATFVVGADTIERVAEPRYYGGDATLRDAAIGDIARSGCRFLVFGREVNGKFMTLGDLNFPVELHRICDEVPATAFREDVSSTNLRKGAP